MTTDLESMVSSQVSPPADAETPADPAEDQSSNPPETPDDTDVPDDSEAEDPPDPLALAREIDAMEGLNLSTKYKTDREALRGLAEAHRLAGRRNEGDRRYQALREKYGEDRLSEIETGEVELPKESVPAKAAPPLITADQYFLWQAQDAAGQLSDSDRAKMNECSRRVQADAISLSAAGGVAGVQEQIRALIDERLADGLKTVTTSHAESVAAQKSEEAEYASRATFYEKHGAELFVDPKKGSDGGLTPFGQAVADIYANDPDLKDDPEGAKRLRSAYKYARADQPPPKAPLKPSRAAKHEPASAAVSKEVDQYAAMVKYKKENPNATGGEIMRFFSQKEPEQK